MLRRPQTSSHRPTRVPTSRAHACRAPAAHRRRSRPDAQPPAVSCLARPGAKAQPPTRPPGASVGRRDDCDPSALTQPLRSSHSGLHPTQRRCVQTTGSTRPQAHSSRCRRSRSRVRPGRRSPRRTRLGRSRCCQEVGAPALNTSRPLAAPAPALDVPIRSAPPLPGPSPPPEPARRVPPVSVEPTGPRLKPTSRPASSSRRPRPAESCRRPRRGRARTRRAARRCCLS